MNTREHLAYNYWCWLGHHSLEWEQWGGFSILVFPFLEKHNGRNERKKTDFPVLPENWSGSDGREHLSRVVGCALSVVVARVLQVSQANLGILFVWGQFGWRVLVFFEFIGLWGIVLQAPCSTTLSQLPHTSIQDTQVSGIYLSFARPIPTAKTLTCS